jgi:manganese/zinc/iron transport system permease protein
MPTGPVIVLICGLWFIFSFIAGPKDGLIMRHLLRLRLNSRIAKQHILRAMWEVCEANSSSEFTLDSIVYVRSWNKRTVIRLLKKVSKLHYVTRVSSTRWLLTDIGSAEASRVVRNHRLWEMYLITYADIAPSHVDRDADMIEHVLGRDLVAKLESLLDATKSPQSPHEIEVQV